MGWDISFYDESDSTESHPSISLTILNLTYNYSIWPECQEYWRPKLDYDGKTVGEAMAVMDSVIRRMTAEGVDVYSFEEYKRKRLTLSRLEDMLMWLTTNYDDLAKLPRHWIIRLE